MKRDREDQRELKDYLDHLGQRDCRDLKEIVVHLVYPALRESMENRYEIIGKIDRMYAL